MKSVEKYILILTNKNYSKRTIEVYSHYLKMALKHIRKNPYHLTAKDIESYLLHYKYTSTSQQNQIIGSLKLFTKYILGKKDIHLSKIERPRKQKKLPRITDAEQLAKKIHAIPNLKHKAILALGLSCGLRISEVVNLKWEHLDRKEKTLSVINGKGGKDRNVKLTDDMIQILKSYYWEYKSKEYVFNGQNKLKYSTSSIQNIFKKHISKNESYHWLRHNYGTFAVDNGTPLPVLQKTMGHSSSKTTAIYLHLSNKSLNQMKTAI